MAAQSPGPLSKWPQPMGEALGTSLTWPGPALPPGIRSLEDVPRELRLRPDVGDDFFRNIRNRDVVSLFLPPCLACGKTEARRGEWLAQGPMIGREQGHREAPPPRVSAQDHGVIGELRGGPVCPQKMAQMRE